MFEKLNVGLVSLGCDKNRVDAELMLGVLSDRNFNIVNDASSADVIIVNTCGFIESAKQESIDAILELAQNKTDGKCKVLIASGCLAERYSEEMLSEIPELDAVIGTGNYMSIESVIDRALKGDKEINETRNINYDIDFSGRRVLTTPSHTAYVKIAEGCNNNCSYCIIPNLRGIYRSRSIDRIETEVKQLCESGIKEIILVAQDTTKYGIDLYGQKKLSELIRRISKVEGIEWIRLLYCYPEDIDDELIEEIKTNDKVCKYMDIPIQHVNDEILRQMRRLSRKRDIEALIQKLRENIPGIVIRTSLIVGFPGETDEQFRELYDFVKEYRIDRVGVFTYSQEEGTDAASFENQIDDNIKAIRQKELIKLQKRISREKNKDKVGQVYRVLIEKIDSNSATIGRTYGDAPEIDGLVYISNAKPNIRKGDFVCARITVGLDYDLLGEIDTTE